MTENITRLNLELQLPDVAAAEQVDQGTSGNRDRKLHKKYTEEREYYVSRPFFHSSILRGFFLSVYYIHNL